MRADPRGSAFEPARSRLLALLAIALVAVSGGLLAEMSRLADEQPLPAVLADANAKEAA